MGDSRRAAFEHFFQQAPNGIDPEAIWDEWQALQPAYAVKNRRPPIPVWARRSFSETGEAAWDVLRGELAEADCQKAVCLYVHIPFCAEKCAFCDCYSFRLKSNQQRHIEAYQAALEQEIEVWSRAGRLNERPFHGPLRGGTPVHRRWRLKGQQIRRLLNAGAGGMGAGNDYLRWMNPTWNCWTSSQAHPCGRAGPARCGRC
jgi:hypothetical protein